MSKRVLTGYKDLRSIASFQFIQFYEVRGIVYGAFNIDDERAPGSQEVDFTVVVHESTLAVRMRVSVYGDVGRYRTDVAAIFDLEEEVETPASRTMQAFVKSEALPILYPFVRQSLWDTSNRLAQEEVILESLNDEDLQLERVMDKAFRSPRKSK